MKDRMPQASSRKGSTSTFGRCIFWKGIIGDAFEVCRPKNSAFGASAELRFSLDSKLRIGDQGISRLELLRSLKFWQRIPLIQGTVEWHLVSTSELTQLLPKTSAPWPSCQLALGDPKSALVASDTSDKSLPIAPPLFGSW